MLTDGADNHVMKHSAAQGTRHMESDDAVVMLDAVADRGILKLNAGGRVLYWSAGARNLFGYSDDEVLGQSVAMFHTDADRTAGVVEGELAEAQESGRVEFEGWRVRKGGQHFRSAGRINTIRDQEGSLAGFVMVIQDLTADQQRAHRLFIELLEAAPDAMLIVGPDGRIVLANAQTDRMFGHPREELVGNGIEILLPHRFRDNHMHHLTDFFADPVLRQMGAGLNLWGLRRDGTEFPVDISLSPLQINGALHVSAAIRDVTQRHRYEQQLRRNHDALLEKQQELERLARVDTLTGLVNHAETIARLHAALENRRLPGAHLGVLFCDADHFKVINDTWGHTIGDVVLATLAQRIRAGVREDDTVGRIGGDEMLVLLPGVHNLEEVVDIAEKVRKLAAEPIHHLGKTICATLSIGATLAISGESVSTMIARADSAMYNAKQAGRNTVTMI